MTVAMESLCQSGTRPGHGRKSDRRPEAVSARELADGGPGSGTLSAKGELSGYGASDQ